MWLVILTGFPGKGKGLFPSDSKDLSDRLRKRDSHTYRARSTWGTLENEVRDDKIGRGMEFTAGGGCLGDSLGPRCITVHRLNGIGILAEF